MAGSRRLTIEIFGDAKGLSQAFGQTESKLGRLSSKVGSVAKGAGLAFAGLGGAAVIAAPQILSAGTELDTLSKKAATVFSGGSLGQVEDWADKVAGSMGFTSDKAIGLAAGMGDLLKPMGFTADQAATMSTDILDLSGALSAWSGGTIAAEEASATLSKALLGEREGLKQLGISISEADVSAQLAKNGTEDLTGAALEQAKAIATQQLIMAKSTDAQEAWADGTMDGVKAQNEAQASIEEVKEGLVKALFPAMKAAVPIVGKLAGWLGDNLPGAMSAVTSFVDSRLVPAFEQHLLPVFEQVIAWVRVHWPEIRDVITSVMEAIQAVVESVVSVLTTLWQEFGDDILEFVQEVWPHIQQVIEGVLDVITGIFQAFSALLKGDWSALWAAVQQIFSGAWAALTGTLAASLEAVEGMFGAAWGVIQTLTDDLVTGVVGAITSIPGLLLDLVGSFFSAGASLGSAIMNGLKGALTSTAGFVGDVGTAIIQMLKDVVNTKLIDPMNAALKIDWDNPIPGLPDLHIDAGVIPRLAKGGIVTSPTLALIGEGRQSEAVIPLDRLDSMIGGGQPIVIYLEIDGRRMATAVADASQRVGGLPFRVSSYA